MLDYENKTGAAATLVMLDGTHTLIRRHAIKKKLADTQASDADAMRASSRESHT